MQIENIGSGIACRTCLTGLLALLSASACTMPGQAGNRGADAEPPPEIVDARGTDEESRASGASETPRPPQQDEGTGPFEDACKHAARARDYVDLALILAGDHENERRTLVQNIKRSYNIAPTPQNRLQLAIVHALPSHPDSDPAAAKSHLDALLSAAQPMSPAERRLARLYLAQVDEQIRLHNEIDKLRAQISSLTDIESSIDETKDNEIPQPPPNTLEPQS